MNEPTTSGTPGKPDFSVAAIGRAFAILDFLASSEGLASRVADIADGTGLPRPTVHRLLVNLQAAGFVSQTQDGGPYRLGIRLFELGSLVGSEIGLLGVARPHLQKLRDETGETVHLANLIGNEVIYLEKFESRHAVRMASRVGARLPAHWTALGKAMLAFTPDPLKPALYSNPLPVSPSGRSTPTVEALEVQLKEIVQRGYSLDDEEVEIGMRCVSAPILDRQGHSLAAISLSAPITRLPHEALSEVATKVIQAANRVAGDLQGRQN